MLAGLGVAAVENWLVADAATTWAPLAGDQRARMQQLVEVAPLDGRTRRLVAFHAGLALPQARDLADPAGIEEHRRSRLRRPCVGTRAEPGQ